MDFHSCDRGSNFEPWPRQSHNYTLYSEQHSVHMRWVFCRGCIAFIWLYKERSTMQQHLNFPLHLPCPQTAVQFSQAPQPESTQSRAQGTWQSTRVGGMSLMTSQKWLGTCTPSARRHNTCRRWTPEPQSEEASENKEHVISCRIVRRASVREHLWCRVLCQLGWGKLVMHFTHGRLQGGGARVSGRLPPWKTTPIFLFRYEVPFATFSPYGDMGAFLLRFSPYRGPFLQC